MQNLPDKLKVQDRRQLPVPPPLSSRDEEAEEPNPLLAPEVQRSAPKLNAKWTPPPPPKREDLAGAAAATWQARGAVVQVLFRWAEYEWSLGNQGSARHLWRRAADVCYLHPAGAGAGGHAAVMMAWARAEFARDNVGNARIQLAEALRRSPGFQPLYVLAANVELAAGNLGESIIRTHHHFIEWRSFCLSTIILPRTLNQSCLRF